MKYFEKKEIEKVLKDLTGNFPEGSTIVGEEEVKYFILPQAINSDLPDFLMAVKNKDLGKYVLGICESVPKELRSAFIFAEYTEFMVYGIEDLNRTVKAEKDTLNKMPDNLKREYLFRKQRMIVKVIELSKKDPETYLFSEEDVKTLKKGIEFLDKKAKEILSPLEVKLRKEKSAVVVKRALKGRKTTSWTKQLTKDFEMAEKNKSIDSLWDLVSNTSLDHPFIDKGIEIIGKLCAERLALAREREDVDIIKKIFFHTPHKSEVEAEALNELIKLME
jgi:hypothetical protein